MKDMITTDAGPLPADWRELMGLGAQVGQQQAFGAVARKGMATQAAILKKIRDTGIYKKYGYTWKRFCPAELGISSRTADRMILNLVVFGPNYFRLAELVEISPESYKLIAGSIADDAIEIDGEQVPLKPENRAKIAAAVLVGRKPKPVDPAPSRMAVAGRKLADWIAELQDLAKQPDEREELIRLVQEGGRQIAAMDEYLRQTTMTLQIEFKR
jgi:hypothetical protein